MRLRLSDLLECRVYDRHGVDLGRVSDVRVVQDGAILAGVQARFRVDALLVGRGGVGERLGFIRGRVRGPWLLKVLFTRLERHAKYIAVADIADWNVDQRALRLA